MGKIEIYKSNDIENTLWFIICVQEVWYVDAQRNMAVTMGERDVKADVKEKSKRDKYKASLIVEGDTAESFLAQVGVNNNLYNAISNSCCRLRQR